MSWQWKPLGRMNKWIDCPESSNISGFGYDEASRTLTIEFKGGVRYDYPGFPKALFTKFKAAGSKGGFFHSNIRDQYTGVKQ